jgi:hypothetical protein
VRPAVAIAVSALAAGVVGTLATGHASDHLDSPRAIADPQADIADVFAFTSPTDANRLVLAMTLRPFAPPGATFSPRVDYIFRVRRVIAPQPLILDPTPLDITCEFDDADSAQQMATCSTPGGAHATAMFGDTGGRDASGMRVFAGRRADPAFFDRNGALATVATGRASFTGENAFAGADVLAIVVEIAASAFTDAGAPPPLLAVAAETMRRDR